METKISKETLIIILNNLKPFRSTQDLYSSSLVNRNWCKVAIPILWESTLSQECYARTLLTQNRFDLSSSPPQATFDYPSFARKLRIDNLLPGIPEVFKKLESFITEDYYDGLICQLCEPLKLICDNILNMSWKLNSNYQVKLLANLISVQKRLENVSIVNSGYFGHDLLFLAIVSQKETLKSLCLKNLCYNRFAENLPPIGKFTSLRELYMKNCFELCNSNGLSLALSFTQLNLCPFSAILNYCKKITDLTLINLSPEQVIAIFNNNFNELRRLSFCCRKRFDANKLLCQMAKNIPESLETIEIRMGIFSVSSLRKFFERWC
ncbi:3239_t:CDS:2 [Diversispora eburnea]|uniref:3239_t:CDS:1 n=1 Tax=Diversispora eburnea TaxID=1213867 RepID=A0A9N8ZMX5_9GLOM|nr:3239_t:CDS:2 [Diversispora eburnea]